MTLPTVTATSSAAKALEHAARNLANSSTWQTLTGLGDAVSAEQRIWVGGRTDLEDEPDPTNRDHAAYLSFGQIQTPHIATGPTNTFDESGSIIMMLELQVPDDYRDHPGNVEIWALNQGDDIVADMRSLAGEAGFLNIMNVQLTDLRRSDETDQHDSGDWVAVVYQLEYR